MILYETQYTAFPQVADITSAFVLWYVQFVLGLDWVTQLSNDVTGTLSPVMFGITVSALVVQHCSASKSTPWAVHPTFY